MSTSARMLRTLVTTLGVIGIAGACTRQPAVLPATPATSSALHIYDPAHELGALFHDIQLARIFPDSKTLVDAKPRGAPAELSAMKIR